MPTAPLRCGRCRAILRGGILNQASLAPCPSCGAATLARVFPVFFAAEPLERRDSVERTPAGAACSFHPGTPAAAACERCGRFVCALCEVAVGMRRLCPPCVLAPDAGGVAPLQREAVLYDRIAFSLGFWPLALVFTFWLLWPVYLITAAATLYVVVRHWQNPGRGLIPRGQTRMILAAALAGVQLLAAGGFAWFTVAWLTRR